MPSLLAELVALLTPERLETNLFRGQSQDPGWGTVYGGQVLGQALACAAQTVEQVGAGHRAVHSLQSYFLRPGDVNKPIVYEVDRIRDGQSFATRKVVAIQAGQAIFNLAASFQVIETGLSHQAPMPAAPPPMSLPTDQERCAAFADQLPIGLRERMVAPRPFEMRTVEDPGNPLQPHVCEPSRRVWLRTTESLPDDPTLHACLLAYASDYSFLTTALQPHRVSWLTPGMQAASLDHVMWFHAPLRVDGWLLHAIDSPRASGARGFVRGSIFTESGELVASTAQEGLMRLREPRRT
jgi:acyl-CoA thioesterase II